MKAFFATSSSVLMALLASMGVVSATSFATALPNWAERLGWMLVHSIWQLTVVAIIVALISTLLRKSSARVQYFVHVTAFITMAVLPCVTWTLIDAAPRIITEKQSDSVKIDLIVVVPGVDRDSVGVSPSPDDMASIPFVSRFDQEQPEARERGPLAPDVREFQVNSHDAALISTPIPPTDEASETRQPTRWEQLMAQVRSVVEPRLPFLVALWFVGVVFCSLRPIWGLWTQWRLRSVGLSQVSDGLRNSLADLARRMGVTRVVRVAQSACVTAPMVVGYLKPMILLPASVLTGLTPDQLDSLLAHELAHVRRHDWLVNAIQVVVETLLFYHPAVWWLSRRIRDERELCCDDIALAIVGDRATYGRMLLALEELRHTNPLGTLVTPATMAATGGSLVARIRRLMPVPREMERTQRGWLSGALALLVLAVSCGVWYATYATAENGDLVRKDDSTSEDSTDKNGATEESPEDRGAGDSASGRRSDQTTVVAEAKVDPTADALRHIARQRVGARDWPQWCGSNHRNNTPSGRNIPTKWDLETGENILWKTEHGRGNLSTPVVANGKVFVGGNNLPELVKRYPKNVDLGCLRAYSAETGEFLWQATHSKLLLGNGETDRSRDWPLIGICSPPTVEGTRLWYMSNRSEVVCLDTEGFRDGENDGPIVDETDRDPTDADFIWRTDLVKDFGVVPHYASASTVLCVGERCFVITSNGVGEDHQKVVNPEAPSFVCLDKNTGKVLWTDNSPGGNILASSWSSTCAFEINGETQIVMAGGDGWLYSFTPEGDGQGHAKLLWKFDGNPKESRFLLNQRSTRNSILATPVFYDGLIYVGVGENPENGEGVGRLWCIDPTKRGDVSQELAVDANNQQLPPRRIQVVDRTKGERAIPNPNSAAVWCYTHDVTQTKNGKPTFEGTMHRTLGNVAIKNGLLFIADFCGLLHCLDAKQTTDGQPIVYWTHDMFAPVWGTPLIVEDKVYVGDGDGDVTIFALSKTKQLIAEPSCGSPIQTTPIVANDTLYITAQDRLIALRKKQPADPNPKTAGVDPAALESGDAQMLAWALVVDGTLADSVVKLGSSELPQQGAYRVIQLDAAKVRQSMFDPAVQNHVYSELQPPQALRLSSRAGDRQNFHWSPFFQMKQNIGSVSGLLAAEYVVFPGTPFDIQFQHSSLSIHTFDGSPPPSYEVNQKSLNFRGEMPIGSAVAFIAKTQSKSGKQDFREVLVFEAVPKLTQQAERLLRDVTWFKAGRAREREALRQAVEFNSRAPKLPDELPSKWTKPLPHGGSVSLVAVARPATHPFCWWNPDGKPCATDWSLQQHAFGTGELIALVCIRDPDRTDFERQGVSYMVSGRNPPLPLYRPWNEAATKNGKDDSELFLFSVYNTDDEQRPMIGVNSGVGPWKELGKLPLNEEVTYGRADYILGGMNRKPDQSVYRSLGRRYLPDEDIRLRLIDKQGKSHPFHPSMFQSNASDTRGIPFGWDGWSTFENQQVKEKNLDHIVLDARARHWATFSGFATELNTSNGNEPPKLTIAPPVAPVLHTLSGRLGSRFNTILRARYSSFLSDDDRAALVDDLKRFTERHQPTTITADRASLIVNGLDGVLGQNVDYLSFFPMYRTLKWRLWMALQQRNHSPDELARREEQREEIRKLIRAIPIKDFYISRTHGHAIAQLEQLFEDPWHGWFHEPMSNEQVIQWKRDQKNWTINDVNTAASNHNFMVMQVKQSSMKDNPHLDSGALPLDAEVIASLKPGLLRRQTRYSSAEAFYGTHDLVFDEAPKPDRRIFDWSKTFVDLPETVAPGLEAVQKWAEENKTGLLAYESARHGLFMLRGAKLGLLPVETWHEADRLSDDELFRIVGEQAKDSILLADHYGPRPKERGYGPTPPGPLLVVESASGELGVLRVKSISNNGITAHLRVRPGAKRKSVAQAEVKAITVGMTQSQVIAIKGKHYRKTVGQRAGQVIHVYDDMAVYYDLTMN